MVSQIAVGAGHDGVEQPGVVTSRDDDPQCPSGQRRYLDGIQRPGQFGGEHALDILVTHGLGHRDHQISGTAGEAGGVGPVSQDRKSTRLNSSHSQISYAVFCLKKKKKHEIQNTTANDENTFHQSISSHPPHTHESYAASNSLSPVSDLPHSNSLHAAHSSTRQS